MSWMLKDLNYTNEAFVYATDCFDQKDIDIVSQLRMKHENGKGSLENGVENEKYRSSTISWISVDEDSEYLYRKITDIVLELNTRFYKFDLVEMETLQYTEYDSATKDFYRSHSDDGYNFNLFRKLSLSIQLSDANSYEGGDLLFYRNQINEPVIAPKSKGTIIMFPSFVVHEVTPVTSGVRKSLVTWIQGPRFR